MPDRDINSRRIAFAGGLMVAVVLLAVAIVLGLLHAWNLSVRGGSGAPLDAPISGARLEAAPQAERDAYFAGKRRELESYGWMDAKGQLAHIPIEVAMQLIAERASAPLAQPPAARAQR
jgi:hypothetical protein